MGDDHLDQVGTTHRQGDGDRRPGIAAASAVWVESERTGWPPGRA
jgi:hypothetical protein